MKTDEKWSYFFDDGRHWNYMDFFDSKEAALKAAMEYAENGFVDTITVGKAIKFDVDVRICTSFLIEMLQDLADDEAGECAENWLSDVTDDALKDLDAVLDTAFTSWFDRHPEYKPNFYTFTNQEKFDKGGNPID